MMRRIYRFKGKDQNMWVGSCERVASIPPGPLLEEMFQKRTVKEMHEVISKLLVGNCGIERLDKLIQALESKNVPAEEDNVLLVAARKSAVQSLPTRGRGMKWKLFWFQEKHDPATGPLGVLVEWNRYQVVRWVWKQEEYRTRGAGVAV